MINWKKLRGIPVYEGSIEEKKYFTIELLGKFFILHDLRTHPLKNYDFLSLSAAKKAARDLLKGIKVKDETNELREMQSKLAKTVSEAEKFLASIKSE